MNAIRILVVTPRGRAPLSAFAAGGHDGGCAGRHAIHAAKGSSSSRWGRTRWRRTRAPSPPTRPRPRSASAATRSPSKGGQGYAPVAGHMSHPYGLASVNSKVANVPADLLMAVASSASAATTRTRRT